MGDQVLRPLVCLALRYGPRGGLPVGCLLVLSSACLLRLVCGQLGVVIRILSLFLLPLVFLILFRGAQLRLTNIRLVRLGRPHNVDGNQDLPLGRRDPLQFGPSILGDHLINAQQLSLTDAQSHLNHVLPMHRYLGASTSATNDPGTMHLAQKTLQKSNALGKFKGLLKILHLRRRGEVETHWEKIIAPHISAPHTVVQIGTKPALGGVLGVPLKIVGYLTRVELVKIAYL
mmetsp:Transcript_99806/g.229097  ORF Transcript_99806/g.229097 Transcript_99806/m.229097 type:complete len:231 (+) Transcript_99806:1172-1864(+)